jgi:hypothetical protein
VGCIAIQARQGFIFAWVKRAASVGKVDIVLGQQSLVDRVCRQWRARAKSLTLAIIVWSRSPISSSRVKVTTAMRERPLRITAEIVFVVIEEDVLSVRKCDFGAECEHRSKALAEALKRM